MDTSTQQSQSILAFHLESSNTPAHFIGLSFHFQIKQYYLHFVFESQTQPSLQCPSALVYWLTNYIKGIKPKDINITNQRHKHKWYSSTYGLFINTESTCSLSLSPKSQPIYQVPGQTQQVTPLSSFIPANFSTQRHNNNNPIVNISIITEGLCIISSTSAVPYTALHNACFSFSLIKPTAPAFPIFVSSQIKMM